jgi:hypothetical protein
VSCIRFVGTQCFGFFVHVHMKKFRAHIIFLCIDHKLCDERNMVCVSTKCFTTCKRIKNIWHVG